MENSDNPSIEYDFEYGGETDEYFKYTACLNLDGNNSNLCSNNTTDFSYIYNFEDTGFATELALVTIFYGLTLVLGIVGNGLVIFTILRIRRMQSVTNVFLTSLASADLLLVLICVPIKYGKWFSFTWDFGWFLCKSIHYMQNVAVICSTLTLTAMSMERYYAICHPMQAKYKCTVRRTRKIIVVLWLVSLFLAVPILYGQTHKLVGIYRKGYWCLPMWPHARMEQVYELMMLLLVLLIPLGVMLVAYTHICLALWTVGPRGNAGQQTPQYIRNQCSFKNGNYTSQSLLSPKVQHGRLEVRKQVRGRKYVIKMLVTIIILFTLCWAPSLIDNVLVAFGVVQRYNYGFLKHMRQAFDVMSYFNSCVNPIVYAFMSKHWRRSFKLALCSCPGSSRNHDKIFWKQTTQHGGHSSTNVTMATSATCNNGHIGMTPLPYGTSNKCPSDNEGDATQL